ncbi:hypothetical protein OpiT1DRAFT_00687 [Opitutaceae bacterium TAV1]|nr:hypothetical protein OpiT1DRAFT_00687 [Opitutaceae bacterium TAV1]
MLSNLSPVATVRSVLSVAALALASASATAAVPEPLMPGAPGYKTGSDGRLMLDGVEFMVVHYNDTWNVVTQQRLRRFPGFPRRDPASGDWEGQGWLPVAATQARLNLTQRIRHVDDKSIAVTWEASADAVSQGGEGVPTRELSLQITLPVVEFAGRTIRVDGGTARTLPTRFSKEELFRAPEKSHVVEIQTSGGIIRVEGTFSLLARDGRKRPDGENYTLRLRFAPQAQNLTRSSLSLLICHQPDPSRVPVQVTAGPDWAPWEHELEIVPGSVFDFSFLSAKGGQAGSRGYIRATPEGHFEFEGHPGERVRFWGVNLCGTANYLETSEADRLAERLSRSGYNSVRLHHFDALLIKEGGKSYEIDPAKLAQLDYLFSALKKRGIYINIDLYSERGFRDDEWASFGLKPSSKYVFKGLIPVSDAAFDAWARYAKNLLTHKNPHTGLTWGEDPALIGICPVNEDSPYARVNYAELSPLWRKAFDDWRGLGENAAQIPAGETAAQRARAYNRFVIEHSIRADQRMAGWLRSLGVRAPLTGSNHRNAQGLAFARRLYDYVDNHQYWDHPTFPNGGWRLPQAHTQYSAISGAGTLADVPPMRRPYGPAGGAAFTPRAIMPTRVFGRPFAVTEFNYCRPNQYRAEGAVLMPAYASLQDWDAIYNFQYASSRETALEGGADSRFSIACDPVNLLADRLGALLFLRGDISPAQGAVSYEVTAEDAFSDAGKLFPNPFTFQGLITRIGSHVAGTPDGVPDGVVPHAKAALPSHEQRHFTSDTGQIDMRTDAGTLRVVTPRSELYALPAGAVLEGRFASVKTEGAPGVIAIASLDTDSPRPLSESRRLLVLHLTDALPTGMTFSDSSRRRVEAWGC